MFYGPQDITAWKRGCACSTAKTTSFRRSGKPCHRVRRLEEITRWFDSHLKAHG